ncbi:MAG: chemotaxis protein CheD [Devosia sp.]
MSSVRSPASVFERGAVTTVHQGDCLVAAGPGTTFSTMLGSCVSACIRDIEAKIGGMNHFLLAEPSGAARDRYGPSARYGAFAMEQLINKVLTQGSGRKANLEFKLFGGGLMNASLADIGAKNIAFVREFLADEGYFVASEDLGGNFARRVMFNPYSGRAFVKRLDSAVGISVATAELAIVGQPAPLAKVDDIELF